MSKETANARVLFADNLTDVLRKKDPVMWNLSNGLFQMAKAVENLEKQVALISSQISTI